MNSEALFVDVAHLALLALVVAPIAAAAFIVGRMLCRSAALLTVIAALFFVTVSHTFGTVGYAAL